MSKKYFLICILLVIISTCSIFVSIFPISAHAQDFLAFKARLPLHILSSPSVTPQGLSPSNVKTVYHLPASGGVGTIAIIGAFHDSEIESDLQAFSSAFNIPACTLKNKCFEIYSMSKTIKSDAGWALETSMDIEWAHAIAPNAHILLVEAPTQDGANLLKAVDYARNRKDVVAISMSWGGPEFSSETALESHFISPFGATFFASSGDKGAGVNWPAVSQHVVAVGGTHLNFTALRVFSSEKAWDGSGGGVSAYIKQPSYQASYSLIRAKGMRAIPDVSYNADPLSGFSVYDSFGYKGKKGWFTLGGTSAGAPQWAAIKALGNSADNNLFYSDKASVSNSLFFRDITNGTNGNCGYFCTARKHYDYVTGLGSPLTSEF